MAVLRPALDVPGQLSTPLDDCELEVARALATLGDGWTVFVRPRVGLDVPDFVAVHDQAGVCAIEVEDWRPGEHRHDDRGVIETRDADGAWHRAPRQPRFHASRCRTTIYDQFFALPGDPAEPTETVRALVVLPRLSDVEAVGLLSHPAIGERERRVAVWGRDGLRDRLEQMVRGGGCAHPRPESLRRLRTHLVPSERSAPAGRPVALGRAALTIADGPTGAPIRRMRGPAGCGKTFGLAARAARLAAEGQRVLLLSFNVTLPNHHRALVADRCREIGADATLVACANFHSLCARIVQDAEQRGIETVAPRGQPWPQAIVAKVEQAFAAGYEDRYDAVLVDEGQDFRLDWWNLLREWVVRPGGEMVLAADPTQALYDNRDWDDAEPAGFTEPWIELSGSYRLPADAAVATASYAAAHLGRSGVAGHNHGNGGNGGNGGPAGTGGTGAIGTYDHDDRALVVGETGGSVRRWHNVERVADLGVEIGRAVVALLHAHPEMSARDVTFLCDYHHDGVVAAAEIEAAGHAVHHIFSRDPDDVRRRRKYRFWPDADAVKGCTVHSFKGWQATALVIGIGVEPRSKRAAYVAMTRLAAAAAGGSSYLTVINADPRLAANRATFEAWGPPQASLRVG